MLSLRLRFTNKFCQMENGSQKQLFLHIRNKIKIISIEVKS